MPALPLLVLSLCLALHLPAASEASASPRQVLLGVRQRNTAVVRDTLLALSDPSSPRYGQYLSLAELDALTTNPASTRAAVAWLAARGFTGVSPSANGLYVRAALPAGEASTSEEVRQRLAGDAFLGEHVDAFAVLGDPAQAAGQAARGRARRGMVVDASVGTLYPGGNTTLALINS